MIKESKYFVEWICPICENKNKKRAYETVSCSKCLFRVHIPFISQYVYCDEMLVQYWKEIQERKEIEQ